MNKKDWLDKLYYDVGKQQYDFRVCGLKKLESEEIKATKWKKYSQVCFPLDPWEDNKIWWVNNREILPCEVVIDLEDKKNIKKVIDRIKNWGIDFKVFFSGSKGYHIHIFFKEKLNEEEKLKIIKTIGADEQKAHIGSMIALEYCPHWKTGNMKEEIKWK